MKRVKLIVGVGEKPTDVHPEILLKLLIANARFRGAEVLFGQIYDERDSEPKA
jgi:hypothetical protein